MVGRPGEHHLKPGNKGQTSNFGTNHLHNTRPNVLTWAPGRSMALLPRTHKPSQFSGKHQPNALKGVLHWPNFLTHQGQEYIVQCPQGSRELRAGGPHGPGCEAEGQSHPAHQRTSDSS